MTEPPTQPQLPTAFAAAHSLLRDLRGVAIPFRCWGSLLAHVRWLVSYTRFAIWHGNPINWRRPGSGSDLCKSKSVTDNLSATSKHVPTQAVQNP